MAYIKNYSIFSAVTGQTTDLVSVLPKDVGNYFGIWWWTGVRKNTEVRIVGKEYWPPCRRIQNRIAPEYSLHFVFGGKGSVDGMPVRRGDVFFLPPDIPHDIFSDEESPLELYWMVLNIWYSADFCDFAQKAFGNSLITHIDKYKRKEIFRFFEIIFDEKNTGSDEKMMDSYYRFILSLLSAKPGIDTEAVPILEENRSNSKLFKDLLNYMNTSYYQPITISHIADQFYISQSHLFRLFKENINLSPQTYLLNKRMEKAAEYLRSNSFIKIRNVAVNVGYKNYANFEKYFRLFYGVSPKEYRNACLKEKKT